MKEIPLTQGKVALVDDEDYGRVSAYRWMAWWNGHRWYAITKIDSQRVLMHRFVLAAAPDQQIDHINGDGLDNRRSQLRFVTSQQNSMNRGLRRGANNQYKGVSMTNPPSMSTWKAQILVDGKRLYLGSYRTPEDAAKAYDAAAKEHFGEFAWLNFPG